MMSAVNRAKKDHNLLFVGRVEREYVAGELASVKLVLIRDDDVAELSEGDPSKNEFVTLLMKVDPFKSGS